MSINTYNISKALYKYNLENPDTLKPVDIALYLCLLDLNNQLKWVKEIGVPSDFTMAKIGVSNKHTYLKSLQKLVDLKFIKIVKMPKNQFQATIISINAVSNFDIPNDMATITPNDIASDTASITALLLYSNYKLLNIEKGNNKEAEPTPPDLPPNPDPNEAIKPRTGAMAQFHEIYHKIKPINYNDPKFKNAFYQAVQSHSEDQIIAGAIGYAKFINETGQSINYVKTVDNFLKDMYYLINWDKEIQNHNKKANKSKIDTILHNIDATGWEDLAINGNK